MAEPRGPDVVARAAAERRDEAQVSGDSRLMEDRAVEARASPAWLVDDEGRKTVAHRIGEPAFAPVRGRIEGGSRIA